MRGPVAVGDRPVDDRLGDAAAWTDRRRSRRWPTGRRTTSSPGAGGSTGATRRRLSLAGWRTRVPAMCCMVPPRSTAAERCRAAPRLRTWRREGRASFGRGPEFGAGLGRCVQVEQSVDLFVRFSYCGHSWGQRRLAGSRTVARRLLERSRAAAWVKAGFARDDADRAAGHRPGPIRVAAAGWRAIDEALADRTDRGRCTDSAAQGYRPRTGQTRPTRFSMRHAARVDPGAAPPASGRPGPDRRCRAPPRSSSWSKAFRFPPRATSPVAS